MKRLEVRGVCKAFGGNRVLHDVSLGVDAGEILAIVGDNGAGKSTLLRIMSGDLGPDSGTVFLDGVDVAADSTTARRARGLEMIYQDLALAPQQDAAANIFLGRELVRSALGVFPILDAVTMRKRAEELLGRLGSDVPASVAPVGLLSGGQQQAVAVARALVFAPRTVLMDEPTAALGVRAAAGVLELIGRLKSSGIAVVLISHRPQDILAVADRVALLEHGCIAWQKSRAELTLHSLVEALGGNAAA